MAEKDLKANLDYVNKHKEELLKEHRNKFILVFNQEVVSSYDTYEKAAQEGVSTFGLDENFLVYHLLDEEPFNFLMEAIL